jgi:hypothetical protein
LLLPPGINLLMALAAWLMWNSWRRTARTLLLVSATSLYLLSTSSVARVLQQNLPKVAPLTLKQIQALHRDQQTKPSAILILSAGRKHKAAEYGDVDTVNADSLELVRYGAFIHRKTQLPIIVAGGSPNGESTAEAVLMNQVLTEEFKVAVAHLITVEPDQEAFLQQLPQDYQRLLLISRTRHCFLPWPESIEILCSPIDPGSQVSVIGFLPYLNNLVISHQSLWQAFRL